MTQDTALRAAEAEHPARHERHERGDRTHRVVGTRYPYVANDILEVVRKMYNWARTAGHAHRDYVNPVTGIVRFPESKRRRFITTVEMPRFARSLEEENSEYARHGLWMR